MQRGLDEIYDEGDPEILCKEAGVDPNEQIAKFVLVDYAACLIELEDEGHLTHEQAVAGLRNVDVEKLADSLLTVSHWPEIFEAHARWSAGALP